VLNKLSWLGCVLLLACADQVPPTQVVVTIDAEARVRAQATGLSLVITDVTDGANRTVNNDSEAPSLRSFPHRMLLVPSNDDATRTYRIEASASGSQGPLAVARLVSGYVARQTRYVRVVLEDACIGKVCGSDQTCSLGQCVEAGRTPTGFADDEASAPVSTDVAELPDPPAEVGEAQVSLPDAGPTPAKATDGGQTPSLPTPPRMPDAGPTPSVPTPPLVPTAPKVTNVGVACAAAKDCTGSAPVCQTSLIGVAAPGNFCSAACTTNAECGPNGSCATGKAIASFGSAVHGPLGTVGYCAPRCSLGDASSCRVGYTCQTLAGVAGAAGTGGLSAFPDFNEPFCSPTAPPPPPSAPTTLPVTPPVSDPLGPAPTEASASTTGPYRVTAYSSGYPDAPGYADATIHVPVDATPPFAGVAFVPGFVSPQSSIQMWGPFLASHGIVVITLGTNTPADQPDVRATALLDGLQTLQSENRRAGSPLQGKLDAARLAIAGWSMGGGGALIAAQQTPSLKAVLTLRPWSPGAVFPNLTVPVMFLAAQNDTLAAGQCQPFYESIPASTPKILWEASGATHFETDPSYIGGAVGRYGLSFFKVFLVGDERYRPLLRAMPPSVLDYRSNL
jgi:dienelactone hydrolase